VSVTVSLPIRTLSLGLLNAMVTTSAPEMPTTTMSEMPTTETPDTTSLKPGGKNRNISKIRNRYLIICVMRRTETVRQRKKGREGESKM